MEFFQKQWELWEVNKKVLIVMVDTASGMAVGALAGTGVGLITLAVGGGVVGVGNYVGKTSLNHEWKSKSVKEHILDGSISATTWSTSAVLGGTMEEQVKNIGVFKGLMSSGSFTANLQRDIYGTAYSGWGKQMLGFAISQYKDYVMGMTLASIKTNIVATIGSIGTEFAWKYYKQENRLLNKQKADNIKHYIKGPSKRGKCFIE